MSVGAKSKYIALQAGWSPDGRRRKKGVHHSQPSIVSDWTMSDRIYLDWNATAPLRPEAREAMARALDLVGNPSSVHAEGRAARALVEQARRTIADALGAAREQVIFTSGGSEANALALQPGLHPENQPPLTRLLVSAIEHPSVLAGGRFPQERIETVPVTPNGVVDLDSLRNRLADGPAMVSVMLANNETGTIQPVREVAGLVHEAGGLLHVDAVQAFGKIELNFNELGADLLSISAHKIGGPKGVGALLASERVIGLTAAIRGGGQEKGRRAGTENVAAIAGFGAAVEVAMVARDADIARINDLRDQLEAGIRTVAGTIVFCADVPRLPNTTLFTVSGLRAETAVIGFDLEGIALSSGSACSSGKVQPSHVLEAMGVPADLARGGLRASLGYSTTASDIEIFIRAWRKLAGTLLKKNDETVLERF